MTAFSRTVCLAAGMTVAAFAACGEELEWEASWNASARAGDITSCVTGTLVSVDSVVRADSTSAAGSLDAIFIDSEDSDEGALDRRPGNGLWIIIN